MRITIDSTNNEFEIVETGEALKWDRHYGAHEFWKFLRSILPPSQMIKLEDRDPRNLKVSKKAEKLILEELEKQKAERSKK